MKRGKKDNIAIDARARLMSRKEFIEALGLSMGAAAAGKSVLSEVESVPDPAKAPALIVKPPSRRL